MRTRYGTPVTILGRDTPDGDANGNGPFLWTSRQYADGISYEWTSVQDLRPENQADLDILADPLNNNLPLAPEHAR